MHVPLSSETINRLRQEALRRGLNPEECARQLIEEQLSHSGGGQNSRRTLDLLDQWDREDQTDDPEELERRRKDFEEFKDAINASHSSNRKIYP